MKIPRLLLAAPSSGSGKTTVACALLQGLKRRGLHPAAFKCGPDYIDPMFHARALGHRCVNLDLFLMGEESCRTLLARNAAGADLAVIEGAMGYYDGVSLADGSVAASAYRLSQATQTPVLLIVDAKGMALSAAALVEGFCRFEPDSWIAGVILNRVSSMMASQLSGLIQERCGIPVVGYLPVMPDCALESRHLGLITAGEVADWQEKALRLGAQAEKCFDWERLLEIARSAPSLPQERLPLEADPLSVPKAPVIAVARDAAFCFYYEDNLRLLEQLGARLVFFSPLQDMRLPKGISGLYLGGGYPELYARQLEENAGLRREILKRLEDGLPCLAECGGFLYLHSALEGKDGVARNMVGFLEGRGIQTSRLQRFGYARLTANRDSVWCPAGVSFPVHEFHYWESSCPGDLFHAQKPNGKRSWECMTVRKNTLAGFPHLHFYGCPQLARRFVELAAEHMIQSQE